MTTKTIVNKENKERQKTIYLDIRTQKELVKELVGEKRYDAKHEENGFVKLEKKIKLT